MEEGLSHTVVRQVQRVTLDRRSKNSASAEEDSVCGSLHGRTRRKEEIRTREDVGSGDDASIESLCSVFICEAHEWYEYMETERRVPVTPAVGGEAPVKSGVIRTPKTSRMVPEL